MKFGCYNSLDFSKCLKKYTIKFVLNPETTTPQPSGGGGCFPSVSRVQLKNGKSISMSELKIGDKVQTGRNNDSNFVTF